MPSNRRRRLVISLCMVGSAIASCAIAEPPPAAAEKALSGAAEGPVPAASEKSRQTADGFVGEHRHSGGDAERKARDAAIDDVVREMNAIARGIARSRLEESNAIAARIAIARDGDALVFTHDGRRYRAAIDGAPITVESVTGDEVSLRYVVRDGAIEQVFVGEEGGRTNTYRLRDDAVVMHVRVHSEKLPKDLVYTLTYGS